jgi:hypothetical protein
MPFITDRRLFQGRPRPSPRFIGSGISWSRLFHCLSVRSRYPCIRVLMVCSASALVSFRLFPDRRRSSRNARPTGLHLNERNGFARKQGSVRHFSAARRRRTESPYAGPSFHDCPSKSNTCPANCFSPNKSFCCYQLEAVVPNLPRVLDSRLTVWLVWNGSLTHSKRGSVWPV